MANLAVPGNAVKPDREAPRRPDVKGTSLAPAIWSLHHHSATFPVGIDFISESLIQRQWEALDSSGSHKYLGGSGLRHTLSHSNLIKPSVLLSPVDGRQETR